MDRALSRRRILQLAMTPALLGNAQVPDLAPITSRIYPGPDGRLVYAPDEQGNTIHDASHAGYGGGGVAIPTAPVRETAWPVAGDNTANIQAAIDKVSALPLDANGLRGAVLLKAGVYRMAMPIRIQAGGVVLRGEGMSDTGTILVGTGTGRAPIPAPDAAAAAAAPAGRGEGPGGRAAGPGGRAGGPGGRGGPGGGGPGGQPTLVRIAGPSGVTISENTRQAVTDEHVPVGARRFTVASARGFRPGDAVIVRRIGNQAWIDALGMNGETPQSRWRPFDIDWDRVVTDVQGNTVTIDAPITCAIEARWGGGEVIKYEDPGRIAHVGVENLRGVSEFDPAVRTRDYGNMDRPNYVAEEYYADENHYANFIVFDNVKHGWVRNATALHFVNSMVGTQRGAKAITVQDCVSREPISRRMGARRFIFALRGQLTLVQRCHSDKGRHSFMTGQPTASGNVFLDCRATSPFSSSEPHEQWATGNLYDNVEAPLTARFWKNISIGWAGANTVFWNCKGDFLVQKPPTAQNFSFGHLGVNAVVYNIPLQDTTKETGHIESLDRHVAPRSLYLTQLRERLGETAVRRVALPDQLV
ncbi:MAG: hypothetical protein IT183_06730 [Acidobacteria bacterium]|nr:hypothetical protein [Acidobacteriota bacterium]